VVGEDGDVEGEEVVGRVVTGREVLDGSEGLDVEDGPEGLDVEDCPEGLEVVVDDGLEVVDGGGVGGGATPPHSFTAQAWLQA